MPTPKAPSKRAPKSAPAPTPASAADPGPAADAASRARAFAIEAARSLADDKCDEVLVLDLRGRSQVSDYIVIGTGTSERQIRAVAQHVDETGAGMGMRVFRSNMNQHGQNWVYIDFVDVVVHVFEAATRGYYDMEMMWGDAERVDWSRPAAIKPAAAKPAAKKAPTKKASAKKAASKVAARKPRAASGTARPRKPGGA